MSAAGDNGNNANTKQQEEPAVASQKTRTNRRPAHVVVHPLVLLSVVDHYNRVAKDTSKRVVGVLLGSRSKMDSSGAAKGEFSEESTAEEKENFAHLSTNTDGEAGRNDEEEEDVGTALNEEGGPGTVVDITNAFAVPFEEDSRESSIWYLDHNYLEDMYAMFRKVQSKEKIVGFYSTGPKIKPADIQIDQLFQEYCRDPVMVIIDVRPTVEGIPTQAYISKEIVKEGKETRRTFQHLACSIGASEPEEIGVEHLLRDVNDPSVSDLAAELKHKLLGLRGMHERLRDIRDYLDNIIAGRLPPNNDILYNLQEIFNLLPNLASKSLIDSFHRTNNDMHLVLYMNSMIRAVLALHDLIGNKLKYRDQDEETDLKDTERTKEKTDGKSDESSNSKKPVNS